MKKQRTCRICAKRLSRYNDNPVCFCHLTQYSDQQHKQSQDASYKAHTAHMRRQLERRKP